MERKFDLWMSEIKTTSLDHTSVYSLDSSKEPKDRAFRCFGGVEKGTHLLSVYAGSGARDRAEYCKSTNDSCMINYAISGVCHQAAGRFLYLSSAAHPSLDNCTRKPGGYSGWAGSRAVYGVLGKDLNTWLRNWANPSFVMFPDREDKNMLTVEHNALTDKILQLHLTNEGNLDENQLIVEENMIVLNERFSNSLLLDDDFSAKYLELLRASDNLYEGYGFIMDAENNLNTPKLSKNDLENVFKKANSIYKEIQVLFRDKMGKENYNEYNDNDKETYDIIDVGLAVDIYSM